jgi:hypothetical protein
MSQPVETTPRPTPLRLYVAFSWVVAALALVQGITMGFHLEATSGALQLHSLVAEPLIIGFSTLLLIVAWPARKSARWQFPVALVAWLAVGSQIAWGHTRFLQAHVPLGVALFGAHVAMALLSDRVGR